MVKLRTRYLETKFLSDHIGENAADSFVKTLSMWELKVEHQICIATDSGANVVNAVKRLDWSRLSCFSHNLHLGVTMALKRDSSHS